MFIEREYKVTDRSPEELRELFAPFLVVVNKSSAIPRDHDAASVALRALGPGYPGMYRPLQEQRNQKIAALAQSISIQALEINRAISSRIESSESVDDVHKQKNVFILNLLFASVYTHKNSSFYLPEINTYVYRESPEELASHAASANFVEIDVPHPEVPEKYVTLTSSFLRLAEEVESTTGLPLEMSGGIVRKLVKRSKPDVVIETEEEFLIRRALEIAVLNSRLKKMDHGVESERCKIYDKVRKDLARQLYRKWLHGDVGADSQTQLNVEIVDIRSSAEPFLKFTVIPLEGKPISFLVPERFCAKIT